MSVGSQDILFTRANQAWAGIAGGDRRKRRFGPPVLHPGGLEGTRELAELCRVSSGKRVLDVASGTGERACYLAEVFRCKVTGIDHSGYMVEMAKRKAEKRGLAVEVGLDSQHATLRRHRGRVPGDVLDCCPAVGMHDPRQSSTLTCAPLTLIKDSLLCPFEELALHLFLPSHTVAAISMAWVRASWGRTVASGRAFLISSAVGGVTSMM
jgi:SAM-dependent methyltransferase